MGGGLKFLGFILPFDVASDNEPAPPRDRQPGTGFCILCKRVKTVTYRRGDGERVCKDDLDANVLAMRRRRFNRARPLDPAPPVENRNPSEPWDRQAVWDGWFR